MKKLTHVEAKVAQLEKHELRPLHHSGSIGKALIAVTMPSYSTTSEDFDAAPSSSQHVLAEQVASQAIAAQYARVRTATVFDGAAAGLSPDHTRCTFSLDVDMKQTLSDFHQHRSLPPSAQSLTIDSNSVGGEDTSLVHVADQGQPHSACFRLQPRRKSKSMLADQLWRKNSCPSQTD